MKKNMRKVAALGLCVALGATMLTACGGSKGKSASGGKTELNFGIWDENQRPAMEKMVKAYEKENSDVKINIQLTPYKGGEYWTKLEAAASGGKLGDGVYPFACPVDFQTWYYQTVYANGGYILSDDKKSTGYDDPKTQEGIQCWIDMYNEGLSPSASALSETTADAMFEGGQLAMNFAGSYMVPEYASNDAIKDKVDCVEIPTFNGKEDNCINGLGYAVFEGSKNKEAAEDFAIWLGSKEAQEIQGKTGVVISARTDAQKCFAEANSQYNLAAYTNHADEAYPLPVCAKAAELYDLEATELQKAYNGEKSLSDVCKGLTKQADKLLQE